MSVKVTYFIGTVRHVTWGVFRSTWDAIDWAHHVHGAQVCMAKRVG